MEDAEIGEDVREFWKQEAEVGVSVINLNREGEDDSDDRSINLYIQEDEFDDEEGCCAV